MITRLKKEISNLNKSKYINNQTILKFINFLDSNKNLIKKNNPDEHICAFFLPVDLTSKSIYIGHHIKADDWIPPGGHIEKNETPLQTVYREFEEELKFKLTNEKVELFDLTIKDVSGNPKHRCKTHYDFWYLVFIKKIDFRFDRKEFHQAEWLHIDEGIKRIKLHEYAEVIKKLNNFIF